MTREELDFIGSMNMCDEISNEAYKKIVCHCMEQEPCEDAISRQAVEKITWEEPSYSDALNVLTEVRDKVRALPPVNAQTKTGHWINNQNGTYTCDKCGGKHSRSNYCPNCGARMVDLQESEDN